MRSIGTIGYEGSAIDEFVASLIAADIAVLADVRAVAVSRKAGFSKNALRSRLETEGIRYVHFVELGDPKPGREAARAGRYDEFRAIYNEHLSGDAAQSSLLQLEGEVRESPTCLLCFERDPLTCHRSIIANILQERSGAPIEHLFVGGNTGDRTKGGARPRRGSGQSLAAAQFQIW